MIPELLADAATALTAVVGLFVGIVAIAVVPFLVTELVSPLLGLSDAQALVAILSAHTVGLLAIYRTFRR